MKRMHCALAILAAIPAAGCRPAARATPEHTPPAAAQQALPEIRDDGIGAAMRGLTLGEFRRALPAGTRVGELDDRFMVDIRAIPVVAGNDTLYHLLFAAGAEVTDSVHLELVATTNPGVRTREGVGPGTTLRDAAARYGQPVLSYNVNDESREYALFPEYHGAGVRFRVRPASGERAFAGVYTTTAEYNSTTAYDGGARILMVLVDLTQRPAEGKRS